MSILDSVKNAFKGSTRPVNSGDCDNKSPASSIGGLMGATKYLKDGANDPIHETAKKNINVAKLLGYPSCDSKNPVNQSGIKPTAINQSTKELIKEPRVRALLDTIAYAEGTVKDPDHGYGRVVKGTVVHAPNHPELLGQRNVTTTDFSKHPEISVRFNSKGEISTAAGRYQFLRDTWNKLKLPDFSPESQDIGAVMLLQGRGSLKPLLNDDFERAVLNSRKEWASFPKSPYGQPTRSMEQLKAFYNEALSVHIQEQEEQ